MKEKLLSITIFIISATALLQLALSQIHISVITKVFDRQIGFYFFLFIIFGVVTQLNLSNVKTSKNNISTILLTLCSAIAVGVGIKYLQLLLIDIEAANLLTFNDIQLAFYMTVASVLVYGVGTIIVLITKRSIA